MDPDAASAAQLGAAARGDLQDVADPWLRQQHPPGGHRDDREHTIVPIQQDRIDREAHPERVDRPAGTQEETLVGRERVAAHQAASALASRLRHLDDEGPEPLVSHEA